MSTSIASGPVLLNRILTLRENTPFVLALDTALQSSFNITKEFIYKTRSTNLPVKIIFVSFETKQVHFSVDEFIDGLKVPFDQLIEQLESVISKYENAQKLIIFDSFNYLKTVQQVAVLMHRLTRSTTTIYDTFHLDIPTTRNLGSPNGPTILKLLRYVATSILELIPAAIRNKKPDDLFDMIFGIDMPVGECNRRDFKCTLIYRRKSGRAMTYQILVDSKEHTYKQAESRSDDRQSKSQNDEDELLNNLTTFNLSTTREQRVAKERVELPFIEAQKNIGSIAGSTVYEFDKDDDYDDDDADNPYEDPM